MALQELYKTAGGMRRESADAWNSFDEIPQIQKPAAGSSNNDPIINSLQSSPVNESSAQLPRPGTVQGFSVLHGNFIKMGHENDTLLHDGERMPLLRHKKERNTDGNATYTD